MNVERPSCQQALSELLRREQVRLIAPQIRRVLVPHFLVDVAVAWIAARAGIAWWAALWWFVMTGTLLARTADMARVEQHGLDSAAIYVRRHTAWQVTMGCVQATLMLGVFSLPPSETHYLLTMIYVGMAAGTVSTVVGDVRGFLSWAVIFGGALSLGWWLRGDLESRIVAGLIVLLFYVLSNHVRDQGDNLMKLVSLSDSLRIERDRAERASQAKTRFFAAASHDLRQPLTALAYHAVTVQALADRDGNEVLQSVALGIDQALGESRSLLDSLLEVSELDAGAVRVERTAVDAAALVEDLLRVYRPHAAALDLLLVNETSSDVLLLADADPVLLRRILQNLIGNALKFTPLGTVALQVRLRHEGDRKWVAITVRDTGVGIVPEAQTHVFEEFFQAGNPERDRRRGLGLGLAIVQRLVDLQGGRILLQSTPGAGSTFEVLMPLASLEASAMPEGAARRGSLAAGAALTVLLVDDEVAIREALSTMLCTMGWTVQTAGDTDDALALWQRGFRFDVLLLDLRLRGGVSGLEALQVLRNAGCHAPALLLTGDTSPDRIALARRAQLPVLYKPVDGAELIETVRRLAASALNEAGTAATLAPHC